jgi:predicted HicB family RNase H-like nuclease
MAKKPVKELRTAALHCKVRPSIKAEAERMATDDQRSLAQWLELMIEAEAARRASTKKIGR